VIDQPVDHGSRIGSSIHVVAKKYLPGLRRRLAREMPIYSLNNAVQERGASMHVTNHVQAKACRDARLLLSRS
jgi:hypothetical protein